MGKKARINRKQTNKLVKALSGEAVIVEKDEAVDFITMLLKLKEAFPPAVKKPQGSNS